MANDALRSWRTSRGLSQDEVARLVREAGLPGATKRTVQRWEGGVLPRPAYRRALEAIAGRTSDELGFTVHPDGRGGHDLHMSEAPAPSSRTPVHDDYSGIWHSRYGYYSSSRDASLVGLHHVLLLQRGNVITVRSLRGTASDLSMDLTVEGNAITGTWAEVTDPDGYYRGARYHGALHMLADPSGRRMTGKWVGFGRSTGEINTGPWELTYLDGSTNRAAVERYSRPPDDDA